MAKANSGTIFTNFSNIQIGSTESGGGFKCGSPVSITDATTYTVLAYNSGKLHVFPNLSANCTITLPTEENGLNYEFIYGGAAADAQNWIFQTTGNTNYFKGGVVHLDANAGSAGDEVVPVYADGNSNSRLTVVTPQVGTSIKLVCDGTNWYLNGTIVSDTVPAFADQ